MPSHPLEAEIVQHVEQYVAGQANLDEFTDWFFSHIAAVRYEAPQSLHDIIGEVTLLWAELTEGIITEAELRHDLGEDIDEWRATLQAVNADAPVHRKTA